MLLRTPYQDLLESTNDVVARIHLSLAAVRSHEEFWAS